MQHLILESMLDYVWISFLSLQDSYTISRWFESPHILVKEANKTKSSKCFIRKKKEKQTQEKQLWYIYKVEPCSTNIQEGCREIEDEREARSVEDSFRNQIALAVETLGICDIGLKASITRRDMIMTGTKRRAIGGGGNGGSTSGRTRIDTVNTTITTINLVV